MFIGIRQSRMPCKAGQLRLTSEVLDLVEVLQSVIAIGGQLAYDKGLAWHVTLPEHRPAE